MLDVVKEIRIVMRISSADVVALVSALGYEPLEVGNDLVVRTVAGIIHSESVVDFFTSVE